MTPARPTVGRPAEQARREEILAVAETIIGQRGYVRTSLSDIAEAAGMQAGSLYHHFESKEALAAEIVERMHDDLNRSVAEFDVTAREPADALREFARTVGVVSDRHRAAVLLSAFDAPANAGGRLSGLVRLEQPALDRTWNALIARVESSGLFRAGVDPGLVSFALSHGSWEVGMHALTRLSPTDMADQFCSILLDGVLTDRQATEGLDDSPASAVVETIVSRWEDTPPSPSDRRGLVLEAGRTEFARRGFTASTMRDVALAADMRVAGVYRIFPSKDALLEAIIGAFSSTLLDGFGQVTAAARTPVEALDGLLGLMAYAGLHFRREFAIVRTWWRVEAPSAPAAALAGNGERYSVLRSVITDGLASSALRPTADVDLYATCIRELMWMPFPQADGVTPAQARDFLRTTVESGALRY